MVQLPDADPTGAYPEKIVQEIQNNKLVIIPSGEMKHSANVVIQGDYLIKCNRGEKLKGAKSGLTVYKIKNKDNLEKAILQLKLSGHESETMEYFDRGINEDLGLVEVAYMKHKDQHVGNCPWASAKAAFRAALYLTLLQKEGYTPERAEVRKPCHLQIVDQARSVKCLEGIH